MHTQFCNYEEMAPRQIRYPHTPVPHLQIRGKSVHAFTGSKGIAEFSRLEHGKFKMPEKGLGEEA